MFLHVFYSWSLAQVFHQLLLAIFFGWLYGLGGGWDLTIVILFIALLSTPCLLFGWLLLGIIAYSRYTVVTKFLLWIFTSTALVLANFWFVLLLYGIGDAQLSHVILAIPAVLSIWLASILRIRQFRKLITVEYSLPNNQTCLENEKENLYEN
jgi:hypothetical protein